MCTVWCGYSSSSHGGVSGKAADKTFSPLQWVRPNLNSLIFLSTIAGSAGIVLFRVTVLESQKTMGEAAEGHCRPNCRRHP